MVISIRKGCYQQDRQRQQKKLFKSLAEIAVNKSHSSITKTKARLQACNRYLKSKKESLTKLY